MADAHKNAAYSLVATAPSPATSGTSLVVTAAEGARFPAVPFNATIWATGAQPVWAAGGATGGNFEIVRVTAISTDTLTITRAQETTTARTVVVGDQIAATVTAKTLTDVETVAAAAYTPGGTDVAVADGGTGSSTAAAARTALGVPTAVGGVEWTVVTKASDESVASSTVLQTDDELIFTAVSGAMYEVQLFIIYASPAGAGTPDLKTGFGEDATNRGTLYSLGRNTADTTQSVACSTDRSNSASYGTAAANRAAYVFGYYEGGGGTFAFVWAQQTSGINATTVRAGSQLRYRRIL